MDDNAIEILDTQGTMAISTLRADGWPQTTIVGYANDGLTLYFLIFRSSQKYANIQHDNRISIAVAPEPAQLVELKAVYAGATAQEITDSQDRSEAWRLLMERHANLAGFKIPGADEAVFMQAKCRHVSVLDFSQGLGHREQLTIDESGVVTDERLCKDAWPATSAEAFDREGMGVAAKE